MVSVETLDSVAIEGSVLKPIMGGGCTSPHIEGGHGGSGNTGTAKKKKRYKNYRHPVSRSRRRRTLFKTVCGGGLMGEF